MSAKSKYFITKRIFRTRDSGRGSPYRYNRLMSHPKIKELGINLAPMDEPINIIPIMDVLDGFDEWLVISAMTDTSIIHLSRALNAWAEDNGKTETICETTKEGGVSSTTWPCGSNLDRYANYCMYENWKWFSSKGGKLRDLIFLKRKRKMPTIGQLEEEYRRASSNLLRYKNNLKALKPGEKTTRGADPKVHAAKLVRATEAKMEKIKAQIEKIKA